MALTAYLPLEAVYQFHETAETWILRRYPPQVQESPGAERTRGTPIELVVDLFVDRSNKGEQQLVQGETAPQTCTVYLRTQILTTDTNSPQPSDVLFDPQGRAWIAISTGDWDEARGFAAILKRAGRRGEGLWI